MVQTLIALHIRTLSCTSTRDPRLMECSVINERIFVQGVATFGFLLGLFSVFGLVIWGIGSIRKVRWTKNARTFAIACFASATLVFASRGFTADWYRSHCIPREDAARGKRG